MITNMPKDKLRATPIVRMFRADPAQLTVGDKLDDKIIIGKLRNKLN